MKKTWYASIICTVIATLALDASQFPTQVTVVSNTDTYSVSTSDHPVVMTHTGCNYKLVKLPTNPSTNDTYTVKDGMGCSNQGIGPGLEVRSGDTESPTTDGSQRFVMYGPYQAATFVYNGTEWNITEESYD